MALRFAPRHAWPADTWEGFIVVCVLIVVWVWLVFSYHETLYGYGLYPYQPWIVVCVWFVSFPTMHCCICMVCILTNHGSLYVYCSSPFLPLIFLCVWYIFFPSTDRFMRIVRVLSNHLSLDACSSSPFSRLTLTSLYGCTSIWRLHVSRRCTSPDSCTSLDGFTSSVCTILDGFTSPVTTVTKLSLFCEKLKLYIIEHLITHVHWL